MPIIKVLNYKT